ncbi:GntR family transcriptional regulator [Virgibacillus sp. CBA3643]|uniref:GntR family transcriptional regulator n=1 Tax=Virgibacillus sp. CBA3643 TaxID=2942278 RepID=UPI0035A29411
MTLDYNNSVPLYIQLKLNLEQNILQGMYKDKIPSEREIIDEYYVSRSTVRQAIDQLVSEGVLKKRPGLGTFISIKPIDDWLGSLSSTTETIQRMGMDPGAKLIESEIIELPEYLQNMSELTKAYHFKRVRYADNTPMGIENHYYPVHLGKRISTYDLDQVTLYDLLERKLDIHTLDAEQVITAGKAEKENAALLEISSDESVLIADRKLVDVNGEFVEFEHAIYRSDMYSFKINLSRKNK